jgi:hypothetical protein
MNSNAKLLSATRMPRVLAVLLGLVGIGLAALVAYFVVATDFLSEIRLQDLNEAIAQSLGFGFGALWLCATAVGLWRRRRWGRTSGLIAAWAGTVWLVVNTVVDTLLPTISRLREGRFWVDRFGTTVLSVDLPLFLLGAAALGLLMWLLYRMK